MLNPSFHQPIGWVDEESPTVLLADRELAVNSECLTKLIPYEVMALCTGM